MSRATHAPGEMVDRDGIEPFQARILLLRCRRGSVGAAGGAVAEYDDLRTCVAKHLKKQNVELETSGASQSGDMRWRSPLCEQSLKLKTHVGQRPVPAYTLVVDKPKLQPANTSGRTRCKEGVTTDGRDSRAANDRSSRVFSCQNVNHAIGRAAEAARAEIREP